MGECVLETSVRAEGGYKLLNHSSLESGIKCLTILLLSQISQIFVINRVSI